MSADYTLRGPLRRPAGKFVGASVGNTTGMKTRADRLFCALGGRWSKQAGGYVLSAVAAEKFETLYAAGCSASIRMFVDAPPAVIYMPDDRELSVRAALKELAA